MQAGYDGHYLSYKADIETLSSLFHDYAIESSDEEVDRLVSELLRYGLIQDQIDILLERYVNAKPYWQITEEYGYINPSMAFYVAKKAIEELRIKGFGTRSKKKRNLT